MSEVSDYFRRMLRGRQDAEPTPPWGDIGNVSPQDAARVGSTYLEGFGADLSEALLRGPVDTTLVALRGLAKSYADMMREHGAPYNLARTYSEPVTAVTTRIFGKEWTRNRSFPTVTGHPVWPVLSGTDLSGRSLEVSYSYDYDTNLWLPDGDSKRLPDSASNNPDIKHQTYGDDEQTVQNIIAVTATGNIVSFDEDALVDPENMGDNYFSFDPNEQCAAPDLFDINDLTHERGRQIVDRFRGILLTRAVEFQNEQSDIQLFKDRDYTPRALDEDWQ